MASRKGVPNGVRKYAPGEIRTTPEKRKETLSKYNNTPERKKKMAEYYQQNKHKAKMRAIYLNYGLSETEYYTMMKEQNHSCKICKKHKSDFARGLAVDHDHITGKIRGLLCKNCNVALGEIKDNIETLKRMINYLCD